MRKARLAVRRRSGAARQGVLELGPLRFPCALGRGGVSARKREGDGATPRGVYRLINVYYRADKFPRLASHLSLTPIKRTAGWCDAPGDRNYNRRVVLPYPASAEMLWRDDGLYDALIVIDYNVAPKVRGRGSAIFLHVARDGYTPTEGCVAISKRDLRLLLQRLPKAAKIFIP